MSTCTWNELREVIVSCAGEVEGLDDATVDTTFEDMGYDSLAILETASALERHYGIELPDDVVGEVTTPRSFLDLVNGELVGA